MKPKEITLENLLNFIEGKKSYVMIGKPGQKEFGLQQAVNTYYKESTPPRYILEYMDIGDTYIIRCDISRYLIHYHRFYWLYYHGWCGYEPISEIGKKYKTRLIPIGILIKRIK